MKMFYESMCRICLVDGAKHLLFQDVERKESLYYKLCFCFKQTLDDIDGYPRSICESCASNLNIVHDLITKFIETSRLLESEMVNEKSKHECFGSNKETQITASTEILKLKNEPDPDSDYNGQEPLVGYWVPVPIQKPKQQPSLTQIKAKLKNLKDIKLKKKPKRNKSLNSEKTDRRTSKPNISDQNSKIGNGKSLRSIKFKSKAEPKKQNDEVCTKDKQISPKDRMSSSTTKKLCDTCGDIFNDHLHLIKHKSKHMMIPEKCPICSVVLSSNSNMKRHIKRRHGERKFICGTCDRGFAFKGELATHIKQVHLRIIRKPKKYFCDKCERHFVTAKALCIHDRSVHTGLRPAECSICGSCFYHEDYLKEHMRLHTGEAPFKCPICNRGYAQRGNLRSHISHNHRLADLSEDTIKNLKPHWFKFLKKT